MDRQDSERLPPTIGSAFQPDNAITALRLGLAVLVVFSHSFVAGGFGVDPLMTATGGQMQLGTVAVIGFFGLSGFLLTRSRERSSLPKYLRNRVLRIVPGLWVCLGFIALVVVPIAVALGGRANSAQVEVFVIHAARFDLVPVAIDGLYIGNASPDLVDVSLWTLPVEILCYVVLAAVPRRLLRAGAQVFLVLFVIANTSTHGNLPSLHLPIAFASGAILYLERHRIPFSGRLALGAVAVTVVSAIFGSLAVVAPLTLPYVGVWLGFRFQVSLTRDLSYGVYIYGWPIQSLLAMLGTTSLGVLPYFVLSLAPVLAMAFVSWTMVEVRALHLRGSRPSWLDRPMRLAQEFS
jgi:peptidoglycan/LPS O-acetylase OafA/YrhL